MKKLRIALILLLAIVAFSLCALLAISLASGGRTFPGNPQNYALILEKEIDASEIQSLKISMSSQDVCFYQGEGDTIRVLEYANYTPKNSQLPLVEQRGSELLIRGERIHFFSLFSFRSRDAYLEVYLPKASFETLDSLWTETASGNITADFPLTPRERFYAASTSGDIMLDAVSGSISVSTTSGNLNLDSVSGNTEITSTSGDIRVKQITGDITASTTSGNLNLGSITGDTSVSSTSGDITLGQVEGDLSLSSTSGCIRLEAGHGSLQADTTSGDITLKRLDGDFQIDTSSGEISILEGTGYGQAEAISGDIHISLTPLSGDLSVSTTSGEVILGFPENSSFTLDFDSTSGECSTFFDNDLSFNKSGSQVKGQYGDGTYQVTVSTTSGDLRVQNK